MNRGVAFFFGIWAFVVVTMIIGLSLEPKQARAQQTGPMTNKEVCQDMKDRGAFVQGGHIQDVINLCAKNGIRL